MKKNVENIDPWNVKSPEEIIDYNVVLFFRPFPEVEKNSANENKAREILKAIVDEASNYVYVSKH